MAVEVQFIGRLGNNLFQYCLGRIVAEALGYELICRNGPGVQPGSGSTGQHATLVDVARHFPGAPLYIPGRRIDAPCENYVQGERDWPGQGVPLRAILRDRRDRRIVFRGYFQRMEYYAPYRDRIRQWLAPPRCTEPPALHPRDVVVSIRRGYDYFRNGWVLPVDYYLAALERLRPRRVYVCGVGIDETIREALAPYRPVYYASTPIDEYAFLSAFPRIVLSNSTFAWWAAWTSNAEQIVFPRCRSYWGEEFPDVDLEVHEHRYIYIDDVEAEIWRPFWRNRSVPIDVAEADHGIQLSVGDGRGRRREWFAAYARPLLEWIAGSNDRFGPVDLLPYWLPYADLSEAKRERKRLLSFLVETEGVHADALARCWVAPPPAPAAKEEA